MTVCHYCNQPTTDSIIVCDECRDEVEAIMAENDDNMNFDLDDEEDSPNGE